ncbi:Uncharacterised protein [Mycobacteroides abscessus subsp. abscessus]|nr:Uncharacterised protein [Mycobacteroides abscessus subsp. abscessus]
MGSRNPGWSPGYSPSRRTGAVAATLGPSGIAIVTFGYHVSNNPVKSQSDCPRYLHRSERYGQPRSKIW